MEKLCNFSDLYEGQDFRIPASSGEVYWVKIDDTTAVPSGVDCEASDGRAFDGDALVEAYFEDDYDDMDYMDGDHDSAMASAGWGTDEDYGGCDERY